MWIMFRWDEVMELCVQGIRPPGSTNPSECCLVLKDSVGSCLIWSTSYLDYFFLIMRDRHDERSVPDFRSC